MLILPFLPSGKGVRDQLVDYESARDCGIHLALESGLLVTILGARYGESIYTSKSIEHIDLWYR
jgi:hypothetical protein